MLQEMSLISSIVKAVGGNATQDALKSYETLKQLSSGPNSLSKKAKQGIFEFPFLISNNLSDLDGMCGVMKSMELEYGNMLLISMGINPTVNSDTNLQIQRTLSNYHTNGNDYSFTTESAYDREIETRSINEMFKRQIRAESSNVGKTILDVGGKVLTPPSTKPDPQNPTGSTISAHLGPGFKEVEIASKDMTKKVLFTSDKIGTTYASMFNSTMISVTLRIGESATSSFTIPIGIKGIPHHLPCEDLQYILGSFIKTRKSSGLNRFIRWRSGEIKGLHNLLFRYDEIKADVDFDKRVGTNNSWLKVLRSRGNNRKVNLLARIFGRSSGKSVETADILPNCTFMLNLSDVDMIESATAVNLFTNPMAASKLLDDSMGLGICIIDDALNVVHIMFSGYTKYTSMPMSAVKSKSNKDGDLTKVMLDIMKKI